MPNTLAKIGESVVLTIGFFVAFFLNVSWIVYMGLYISTHLVGVSIASLGLLDLAIYTGLTFLPLFIVWTIWGYFYQFIQAGALKNQLGILAVQIKQSHEYSDMIARLLIRLGTTSTDEFIVGKTDLFINEMNEMLADIVTRYKLISDKQADKIWSEVQKGNKWGFAKAIINIQNSNKNFQSQILDTAQAEHLLAGTINEFCTRYTKMTELLRKHDKERVFVDIVETGAFGKVFAIFAGIYDRLNLPAKIEQEIEEIEKISKVLDDAEDILEEKTASEPKIEEDGFFATFDRQQEEPEEEEPESKPAKRKKSSKKINLPKLGKILKKRPKKDEDEIAELEQQYLTEDPFSIALERSFGKPSDADSLNMEEFMAEKPTDDKFAFSNTEETLKSLQQEWASMKKNKDNLADVPSFLTETPDTPDE